MKNDGPSHHTTFDLHAEAEALQGSEIWRDRGLNTRTLLKLPDLRLVLIALKSGHRIQRHQTDMRLNLTTLTGHVQLAIGDETINLPEKSVLILDPAVPHDVVALEDSILVLSLTSPA